VSERIETPGARQHLTRSRYADSLPLADYSING
jgi:hypothetical protein